MSNRKSVSAMNDISNEGNLISNNTAKANESSKSKNIRSSKKSYHNKKSKVLNLSDDISKVAEVGDLPEVKEIEIKKVYEANNTLIESLTNLIKESGLDLNNIKICRSFIDKNSKCILEVSNDNIDNNMSWVKYITDLTKLSEILNKVNLHINLLQINGIPDNNDGSYRLRAYFSLRNK